MFAVEMLNAPETSCSNGAFLRVWWEVLRHAVGVETHPGGGCEGAEEAV